MLLDDSLEHGRIALAVPRALGVNDGHRPSFANAETVGFRSQDASLLGQAQLLQAALQKVPRDQASILLAAFRVSLIAAEKDVTTRDAHADTVGDLFLRNRHLDLTRQIRVGPRSAPVRLAARCTPRAPRPPRPP